LSAPRDVQLLVQLAQTYARVGQAGKIQPIVDTYVAQSDLSSTDMLLAAQVYLNIGQIDGGAATFELILKRFPQESQAYYWLALIRANQMAFDDAFAKLEKAIELNPALRDQVRNDQRFGPIRNNSRFLQLIGAAPTSPLAIPPLTQ
ncbi:MAG: tetratricopeptide repeat protein, partial [Gammaproteobacteria bacterium]